MFGCFILLCDQLLPIRKWRCQDIDQVLLRGPCFLSSASSSTEVPGQNRSTSILSKLPTTACWFRKNVGKDSKLAISDSNCASFVEANHSTMKSNDSLYFQSSSSPVEANNSKSVQVVADNSTVESCSLSVSVSVGAKELKTCRSLVEANYATVKSDDCFTLKSNDSLHFQTSSLPVEANNSKSVSFGPADSTVELCFLFVEAKELKKIGSLVDAKYSTAKSNDCLDFETKSDVEIICSNVDSKCLSVVEEKENIKSSAFSGCFVINDEQFVLSELNNISLINPFLTLNIFTRK